MKWRTQSKQAFKRVCVLLFVLLCHSLFSLADPVPTCDEAGLRAAILKGGLVTFPCDTTISVTSAIEITKDVTLDATGHQVAIDGSGKTRLFIVDSGKILALRSLALTSGAADKGAAVWALTDSVLFSSNCEFKGNTATGINAPGAGGAIFNDGGTVHVDHCQFTGNAVKGVSMWAAEGGAIFSSGQLYVDQCRFLSNSANGLKWFSLSEYGAAGSAILQNGSAAQILGSTFEKNNATSAPAWSGSDALGTVYFRDATVGLANNLWAENQLRGTDGINGDPQGGLGGYGGNASGAGIFVESGSISGTNNTFYGNLALAGKGGQGGYPAPSAGSGMGGLGGSAFGAAIYVAGGAVKMTHLTVVSNSCVRGEAGAGAGTGIPLATVSISGDPGIAGPALATKNPGSLALGSSVLSANYPANCDGIVTDLHFNLSSDATPFAARTFGNLQLGPLAENGGPTRTIALLDGSPAIDFADGLAAPAVDQRGVSRNCGVAPDAGAFEFFKPPQAKPDEAALRAAIEAGGFIKINSNVVFRLSQTLVISKDTAIDATDGSVVFDGQETLRPWLVRPNIHLILAHVTTRNGVETNGGALYNDSGIVLLSDCTFSNNTARGLRGGQEGERGRAAAGGAICNHGVLTAAGCRFVFNTATGGVGGIGALGTIPKNYYLMGYSCRPYLAGGEGYPGGGGGDAQGGAIFNDGSVELVSCIFNRATALGGTGGTGGEAGGSACGQGPPPLAGQGGPGGNGNGGAIYSRGSSTIQACTFSSAVAEGGAGGSSGAPLLSPRPGGPGGNALGGAIFNSGQSALTNVIVEGALSLGGDGGLDGAQLVSGRVCSYYAAAGGDASSGAIDNSGEMTVVNCTLWQNVAAAGYSPTEKRFPTCPPVIGTNGIVFAATLQTRGAGETKLANSIVGNPASTTNVAGPIIDGGHNIVTDLSAHLTELTSRAQTDPQLEVIESIDSTIVRPLPGSPAIDAGDNQSTPLIDLRGATRPFGGGSDIGAIERGFADGPLILEYQNGIATLRNPADPGGSYILRASSDLVTWEPVLTNTASQDGVVRFTDKANHSKRFYQAAPAP